MSGELHDPPLPAGPPLRPVFRICAALLAVGMGLSLGIVVRDALYGERPVRDAGLAMVFTVGTFYWLRNALGTRQRVEARWAKLNEPMHPTRDRIVLAMALIAALGVTLWLLPDRYSDWAFLLLILAGGTWDGIDS